LRIYLSTVNQPHITDTAFMRNANGKIATASRNCV